MSALSVTCLLACSVALACAAQPDGTTESRPKVPGQRGAGVSGGDSVSEPPWTYLLQIQAQSSDLAYQAIHGAVATDWSAFEQQGLIFHHPVVAEGDLAPTRTLDATGIEISWQPEAATDWKPFAYRFDREQVLDAALVAYRERSNHPAAKPLHPAVEPSLQWRLSSLERETGALLHSYWVAHDRLPASWEDVLTDRAVEPVHYTVLPASGGSPQPGESEAELQLTVLPGQNLLGVQLRIGSVEFNPKYLEPDDTPGATGFRRITRVHERLGSIAPEEWVPLLTARFGTLSP